MENKEPTNDVLIKSVVPLRRALYEYLKPLESCVDIAPELAKLWNALYEFDQKNRWHVEYEKDGREKLIDRPARTR